MANSNNIILSIIVISHNQREELRRCLESIFSMQLSFPFEIIVSDDRSHDGTREMLESDYRNKVITNYCNSNDGHCANNSQRSGYNRCSAYKLINGKYFAHVDADDYFLPNALVYEKQVNALEQHPECSLAMSNCLYLDEGTALDSARPWDLPRKMIDGEIINQTEFVSGDYFRINQCFMQRRNPDVDPVALYGNRYVDSVITYHHLLFGKVVYVDACDYVYTQHLTSITRSLLNSNDNKIVWCLGLYIPALIPQWSSAFIFGAYYQSIRYVLNLAMENYQLSDENYKGLESIHAWIFDCFHRDKSLRDQTRLSLIVFWMKLLKRFEFYPDWTISLLRHLLFY